MLSVVIFIITTNGTLHKSCKSSHALYPFTYIHLFSVNYHPTSLSHRSPAMNQEPLISSITDIINHQHRHYDQVVRMSSIVYHLAKPIINSITIDHQTLDIVRRSSPSVSGTASLIYYGPPSTTTIIIIIMQQQHRLHQSPLIEHPSSVTSLHTSMSTEQPSLITQHCTSAAPSTY